MPAKPRPSVREAWRDLAAAAKTPAQQPAEPKGSQELPAAVRIATKGHQR